MASNGVAPKLLHWSPNSQYLKMWPYLKIEILHMKLVEMRSYWSGVDPWFSMTNVLMKRGDLDTDTHTGKTPCEDKGRYQGDIVKSKECQDCQKTTRSIDRNMKHISPSQSSKENSLADTLILLSNSLQNSETIKIYCWSPLVCDPLFFIWQQP